MSGVFPPPTDPNDRPRPPGHHGLHRRKSIRPALDHRRKRRVRKPYLGRFRKGQPGLDGGPCLLRPDPLARDWLANDPGWRATLRRIVKGPQ